MRRILWLHIFLMGISFIGCSPVKRHKILTTIFDGVAPYEEKEVSEQDILAEENGEGNAKKKGFASEGQMIKHPPYEARECDYCHVRTSAQSLAEGSVKDLCFSCHEDFISGLEKPHYPANEGLCLACHHHHQSENKFLLLRIGQSLCFECHNSQDMKSVPSHKDIGETNCIKCHAPHGK